MVKCALEVERRTTHKFILTITHVPITIPN